MRFGTTHWISERFPDAYVRALRSQCHHLGHSLTVLGNGEDFDAPLIKPDEMRGWWAKLEWFAPWNAALRPAVVFDLDTYLIGGLSPFLDLDPQRLWLIREFLNPQARGESGIFVVPDNDELCKRIWERALEHDPNGADGALMRAFPHSLMPDVIDGIYSYEAHCRGGLPKDARVVCFHGRWKPPVVTTGWAFEWWQTSLNSALTS